MSTVKVVRSAALQKRRPMGNERSMVAVEKVPYRPVPSDFITEEDLAAARDHASDEQKAQLRVARERVIALLASPHMDPHVLRAKAERAAQWEETHGPISAFVGKLK
jgi:hydroxyacyl-ACP dehydratase HTD2-like protein with hotdog domain